MNFDWQGILYILPGIILGLTLHEFCHAWASFKLGDDTAKSQGRLTLNPLKHIDPIGFAFLIFARFGWAKPVQFNMENLSHPRRDKALIAAAGPASNFLLAMFFVLLIKGYQAFLMRLVIAENWDLIAYIIESSAVDIAITVVIQAAYINLALCFFNLLPIPPLDGSHIVFSGLNLAPETERNIMKIGAPLLIVIILIQNFSG
ncbi:MAG: site-2 protease family protein, partial [Treponema sp.]|nr:site-2 protease family protein [Treponema sp.]